MKTSQRRPAQSRGGGDGPAVVAGAGGDKAGRRRLAESGDPAECPAELEGARLLQALGLQRDGTADQPASSGQSIVGVRTMPPATARGAAARSTAPISSAAERSGRRPLERTVTGHRI